MNFKKEDIVELAFKEDGLLSKQFNGYRVREQQVELAKKIQESIKEGKPLLGEAPTGVGKSLAALIPAFETIIKDDAPVIVVTSSIILQEQYFNKDVPLLEKIFNYDTGAVLIKGRNNYLCKVKHNEFKAGNFTMHSNQHQGDMTTVMNWANKTKTGDMSELDIVPHRAVWSQFAAMDSNECARKDCPLFGSCHYYVQRNKVTSSKLVICNYHYYFSALQTEGMLPTGAKVVIMDEGHEIAAIARDFQERKYSSYIHKNSLNGFLKSYKAIERTPFSGDAMGLVEDLRFDLVQSSLDNMMIEMTGFFHKNKRVHLDNIVLKEEDRKYLQDFALEHKGVLERTYKFIERYLEFAGLDQEQRMYWQDIYEKEEITWQLAIENLLEDVDKKLKFLEDFFLLEKEQEDLLFGDGPTTSKVERDSTIVYWIQGTKDNSVSLHIKPSSGADLTGGLFEEDFVPIVLSATLSVNKEFDHLKTDLGIQTKVNELIVGSPFNLTENLLWYLPSDIPAGNTQDHQMSMLKEMERIATTLHGRTLCLFTSNRNLTAATQYFRKVLPKNIQVLSQTELPKQKIIETMKENPNVVITATRSFFTGVDIQGQNLSAVLIDKLPFPMIGDPVNDYLMSVNRGFWTFTLPETIIALKQGFGRLNRTSSDKGVVAIFDGRLSTAGYKNRVFNSFDFKLSATRDWERVCEYLNTLDLN